MPCEMKLPGSIEEAYEQTVGFVNMSKSMRSPSMFVLKLDRRNTGEEALKIAIRNAPELPFLFMPTVALREHRTDDIIMAVRQETERLFGRRQLSQGNDLWQVIAEASLLFEDVRPVLWLNFTDVPQKIWPYWRILIEQNVCSLMCVCTRSQWSNASEVVPEFTDCVCHDIVVDGFLSDDDYRHLESIVSVYYRGEIDEQKIAAIRKELSEQDIAKITEVEFQKLIWSVLTGGV